jgi:hypothetical protein
MEFGGETRHGVAIIERQRGRRIEFGVFQVGAVITAPQEPQVRRSTLE